MNRDEKTEIVEMRWTEGNRRRDRKGLKWMNRYELTEIKEIEMIWLKLMNWDELTCIEG